MAGLVFHFESNGTDVFSGREQDIDAWRYAAQISGDITDMVMINSAGWTPHHLDQKFEWQVVEAMPDLPGTVTYVATSHEAGVDVPLWDFDHQTDWYVFGPAKGWGPGVHGIYLPQHNHDVALHALHVVETVMFHRYKVLTS